MRGWKVAATVGAVGLLTTLAISQPKFATDFSNPQLMKTTGERALALMERSGVQADFKKQQIIQSTGGREASAGASLPEQAAPITASGGLLALLLLSIGIPALGFGGVAYKDELTSKIISAKNESEAKAHLDNLVRCSDISQMFGVLTILPGYGTADLDRFLEIATKSRFKSVSMEAWGYALVATDKPFSSKNVEKIVKAVCEAKLPETARKIYDMLLYKTKQDSRILRQIVFEAVHESVAVGCWEAVKKSAFSRELLVDGAARAKCFSVAYAAWKLLIANPEQSGAEMRRIFCYSPHRGISLAALAKSNAYGEELILAIRGASSWNSPWRRPAAMAIATPFELEKAALGCNTEYVVSEILDYAKSKGYNITEKIAAHLQKLRNPPSQSPLYKTGAKPISGNIVWGSAAAGYNADYAYRMDNVVNNNWYVRQNPMIPPQDPYQGYYNVPGGY